LKIVLTGGAGFIGTPVLARLRARGHDVVVLDSLRTDVHRGAPPVVDGLVVGDVRDPDALDSVLRGMDVVVHLAAKVGLGVDVQDLPDYADSNVHGTAAVLAAMARTGVDRLVLASSMVVYGEGLGHCPTHGDVTPGPRLESELAAGRFEPPCPVCGEQLAPALVGEDAPMDPRNAYAASKLGQEQFAASWARVTGGSVAALRYHNVYGPGLPMDTPYAGVAAIFLSALRGGAAPRVFEDGGQRRDFVHVRDIAAASRARSGPGPNRR
jgi:dTDP-L-rhamnose 4-epimerase